jgi:hypothetical protein
MPRNDKSNSANVCSNPKPDQSRSKTVLALASVLGASLGLSWPASAGQIASDAQKQRMERWKIMQDTQTKIDSKKSSTTSKPAGSAAPMGDSGRSSGKH